MQRKRLIGFGAAVLVVLILGGPWAIDARGQQVTVWEDSFESGGAFDFPQWSGMAGNWKATASTVAARSGGRGADIYGPSAPEGDSLTLFLSTAGYQELTLTYWWKIREKVEPGKFVFAEYTVDAGDVWIMLVAHNGEPNDWSQVVIDFPKHAWDNPNFGLRLRSTLVHGVSSDRMHFDDFAIMGVPEPASLLFGLIGGLVCLRRRR